MGNKGAPPLFGGMIYEIYGVKFDVKRAFEIPWDVVDGDEDLSYLWGLFERLFPYHAERRVAKIVLLEPHELPCWALLWGCHNFEHVEIVDLVKLTTFMAELDERLSIVNSLSCYVKLLDCDSETLLIVCPELSSGFVGRILPKLIASELKSKPQ